MKDLHPVKGEEMKQEMIRVVEPPASQRKYKREEI